MSTIYVGRYAPKGCQPGLAKGPLSRKHPGSEATAALENAIPASMHQRRGRSHHVRQIPPSQLCCPREGLEYHRPGKGLKKVTANAEDLNYISNIS